MNHEDLSAEIDWSAAYEQATELLRTLLRIDTTNADGVEPRETQAARVVQDFLSAEGLESELLEPIPGKGNLIARIRGDGTGGAPIMCAGHLDVVPAGEDGWEHPPFAAEIHDGCIWGRGAIDCKNMVAMQSVVAVLLNRLGVPLKRDLIVAAVADEEAGCEYGSRWLVDHHPDAVQAEFVLNEAGGYSMYMGERRFWPVQVAEKGMAWLTIRATGTAGHGSLPNHDNPVAAIGRAAHLLGSERLPYHLTPPVRTFIETLSDSTGLPESLVLRALLFERTADMILDRLFPDAQLATSFEALLHNTVNSTMLVAGDKVNQVPGSALMRADGRTLPGFSSEDLVAEVAAVIGDGYEITVDLDADPVVGSAENVAMDQIRATLLAHDPDSVVLPYVLPAFTDAKSWSRLGSTVLGFTPIDLPRGMAFTRMFHGVNERIPVDGFHFGVRALFDVVAGLVT